METSMDCKTESSCYEYVSMADEMSNNPQADLKSVQRNQDMSQKKTQTSHICDVCGKMYTQKRNLTRHGKSHILDKDSYKCDVCGKAYSRQDCVKRHFMLLHPGLQYYPPQNSRSHDTGSFGCIVCGKKYTRQERLKRHFMLNHGNQPYNPPQHNHIQDKDRYECIVCRKNYARQEHVKRHFMLHHGDLPYYPPQHIQKVNLIISSAPINPIKY